ncbi:hypothetical protein ACFPN7_28105 [Amycolatopsis halotolerans]|uniref:hypothetical protein n=1 Tax=Amycolatopsis halotolerans TaxID=330083 RepID=UPI00361F2C89
MPRRRPGAVRADRPEPRDTPIPGISRRAQAAIEFAAAHRGAGSVSQALDRYRSFLRQPGRWLYVPWTDCPCCDPVDARDELEAVLRALPPGARAELRRVVAPLDEEFRRRTLPDPTASSLSSWHAAGWWRQRLQER